MVIKMKCPICGNEEFFYIPNPPSSGNKNVYTVVLTGAFSGATANRYVCTSCGYLVEKFEGEELKKSLTDTENKIKRIKKTPDWVFLFLHL